MNTTCVFERKLTYKPLPTELAVRPTFRSGKYIAYAMSQSKGQNSSFSNAVDFTLRKWHQSI